MDNKNSLKSEITFQTSIMMLTSFKSLVYCLLYSYLFIWSLDLQENKDKEKPAIRYFYIYQYEEQFHYN